MAIFTSFDISASGMTAQRLRSDIISQNLANVNSTSSQEGGAYRRKTVVFSEKNATAFSDVLLSTAGTVGSGVKVTKIVEDYETPMSKVYDPAHPDADEDGYVTYPNVNVVTEIWDFFYFFFHLGLDLLREYGVCSLITTNYYLTALGGKVLRSDFKNRADIIELFNFNETKVFNTALGQHNIITSLQKGHTGKCTKSYVSNISGAVTTNELQRMLIDHVGVACTLLSQDDIYDGEENYIRMFGVKNDTNPINSILDKIVSLSTDVLGNICNPLIGLESSLDEVYVLSKAQVEEITQNAPNELKYIKEFFKGSMIHRYHVENETDKYILYLHEKIEDITSLKGIWKYLKKNETAIKGRKGANLRGAYRRGNWWVLNTPRLDMDFSEEKIVTHYRTKSLRFALSSDSWYASRDVYYITKNKTDISLKYILALLNSSLYYQWFYNRGKRKGDTLELYAKPLKEVPIKEVDSIAQQPFIDLVDEIISQKEIGANTDNLEKEIDYLVYKLYELTDDEIAMMESFEMRYGII